MKRVRSTAQDLRELFDTQITVRFIAVPVHGARLDDDGMEVQRWMTQSDFDVTLVQAPDGRTVGYVSRSELEPGPLADQVMHLGPDSMVTESTPVLKLFQLLRDRPWRFVLHSDGVTRIVTRGDLRQAPVRMYLFALVNLLEMHLNDFVRHEYPDDSWTGLVKDHRLAAARKLLEHRRTLNEATDLVDCLQIADKARIVVRTQAGCDLLGFDSRKKASLFFKRAERLRNGLAHTQDIRDGMDWNDLFDVAEQIERFVQPSEARHTQAPLRDARQSADGEQQVPSPTVADDDRPVAST